MKVEKKQRPRKPSQPIKVIHRPKSWFEDNNRSELIQMARTGSFERVGNKIAFVHDANGSWRLWEEPEA